MLAPELSKAEQEDLLKILEQRFASHMERHPEVIWETVKEKLQTQPDKMWTLNEMERTGGEPDVVGHDVVYMDCSAESPSGRRSLCYDRAALKARKKNKPANDAQTFAAEIGIELLTEKDYRKLQTYGAFDLKTSSWIQTPPNIRDLGGAIFCDRRYDTVFTYHNGAESYYSVRGFRGKLYL